MRSKAKMAMTRKPDASRLDTATLELLNRAGITLPDGSPWARPEWMQRNFVEAPLTLKLDGTPAYSLIYQEGPKGIGKTPATLHVHGCEMITHGRTLLIIAGRDRQAIQPDRDFLVGMIERSPLLRARCRVQADVIHVDGGSRIEFWAADERGVHGTGGAFPRFRVIAEDVFAWPNHALLDSLLATAIKTPNSRVTICTNPAPKKAGRLWSLRTQVQKRHGKDSWFFAPWAEGRGPEVPWIRPEVKERMRAVLPKGPFARFIEGHWSEDASFIERDAVLACIGTHTSTQSGPWDEYVSFDYGPRRHFTGLAWGHPSEGRFYVDGADAWNPAEREGGEVMLRDLADALQSLARGFRVRGVLCDPFQAYSLIQELRGVLPIQEFSFSVPNQVRLAQVFYEGLTKRTLVLPSDAEATGLVDEIAALDCVPVGFGFRFEYTGDGHGHGDRAVALALAYFAAVQAGLNAPSLSKLVSLVRVSGTRLSAGLRGPIPYDRSEWAMTSVGRDGRDPRSVAYDRGGDLSPGGSGRVWDDWV